MPGTVLSILNLFHLFNLSFHVFSLTFGECCLHYWWESQLGLESKKLQFLIAGRVWGQ